MLLTPTITNRVKYRELVLKVVFILYINSLINR